MSWPHIMGFSLLWLYKFIHLSMGQHVGEVGGGVRSSANRTPSKHEVADLCLASLLLFPATACSRPMWRVTKPNKFYIHRGCPWRMLETRWKTTLTTTAKDNFSLLYRWAKWGWRTMDSCGMLIVGHRAKRRKRKKHWINLQGGGILEIPVATFYCRVCLWKQWRERHELGGSPQTICMPESI